MKKLRNVEVVRRCNVVMLKVQHNTPEGKYITEWLDKRNMLSDVTRQLINLEIDGINGYNIKAIIKKCKVAKLLARRMKEKIDAAMQSMPRSSNVLCNFKGN